MEIAPLTAYGSELDPQERVKNPIWWYTIVIPELGRETMGKVGACWPFSLTYLISSRPKRGPVSKKKEREREKRAEGGGMIPKFVLWLSHICIQREREELAFLKQQQTKDRGPTPNFWTV